MKALQTFFVTLSRTILAVAFWLAIRLTTALTIRGVKKNTVRPCTYLGMTHKRDIDPFILLPIIVFHRDWKKRQAREVHFALRGDGFTHGFLARMVERPGWLAWLLRPLSVGAALRWLGTYPADGLLRPAEEWIREVLQVEGDMPICELLSPDFLQKFARATRLSPEQICALQLSQLLAWRYHAALQSFQGPEMLLRTERRIIERRVIGRIHEQLDEVVAYLQEDGSIFGAPEGQLSPDGHIGPLHSGFHRMVRLAPPDLHIIPVALIYDFMTNGRPRVFVDFAPAIENASQLSQASLEREMRRSWLQHAHFTCTQLASGFLMERRGSTQQEFTLYDLARAVYQQACRLAEAGRQVDPQLLRPSGVTKRVRSYLAYVEQRGLIQRCTEQKWKISFGELKIEVAPREVAYDDVPLLYAYNELQDLLNIP